MGRVLIKRQLIQSTPPPPPFPHQLHGCVILSSPPFLPPSIVLQCVFFVQHTLLNKSIPTIPVLSSSSSCPCGRIMSLCPCGRITSLCPCGRITSLCPCRHSFGLMPLRRQGRGQESCWLSDPPHLTEDQHRNWEIYSNPHLSVQLNKLQCPQGPGPFHVSQNQCHRTSEIRQPWLEGTAGWDAHSLNTKKVQAVVRTPL